jgi:DNA (cytosine-5)-methyltransferase 1
MNEKRNKKKIIIKKMTTIERPMKMIDLFSGTGAFSHAFEKTGQVCVFANDMVPWSKTIYDANFHHKLTLGNLNDIPVASIPKHDILTGGFPCQPFSIAGKQEGFHDERSNVFWKILAIIDHHAPSFVILENVKNLVSHDDGKTFEIIKKNLLERNYHIRFKVLDTSEITGIPQHRERIYIVCMKSKDIYDEFSLDFPKIPKAPISSLLESVVPEKYYYTDKSTTWDLVKRSVIKKDTVYQYRRVYVRENKSDECPTLTANMGSGGHNVPLILDDKGIRKLTPRECFNFQGFPSTYILPNLSDANLYKLAGNAVSLPVVELIAQRLLNLINSKRI